MRSRAGESGAKTAGMLGALALVAGLSLGGCGGIIDEQAEKRFTQQAAARSITLYPALVRQGDRVTYDAAATRGIAEFLHARGLATATIAEAEIPVATEWGMNQARMFRDSVHHVQDFLAAHPVTTAYAALPEYLLSPGGTVIGVHFYTLAADGTPVYGILTNSHHEVFQRINPKNASDCTQIITDVLGRELKGQE